MDSSNNLWLFGGFGLDADGNEGTLNDVWEWNPSTKEWAWMGGSNVMSCTVVEEFGLPFTYCGVPGSYGTLGTPGAENVPAGRDAYSTWTDSGGNFWLSRGVSDLSGDVGGDFDLNDLWKFDPTSNEWTWESGSSSVDQTGVYGALGVPEATNILGGRASAAGWMDKKSNFRLFGGAGYDATSSNYGLLNDLWMYQLTGSSAAALTSPAPGGVLTGRSATFPWTAGTGATGYDLWLGVSGPGSSDIYASGTTASTSAAVTGLPLRGGTVYARLMTLIGGSWQATDYTYTAATGSAASLPTPTPSSKLGGSSVTFNWTSGTGVTSYDLYIGATGPGSSNVFNSGATTATSVMVFDLPDDAETLYARLFSKINGVWQYQDYVYTESSSQLASMITLTNGSTLGTSNIVFTWTSGVGVLQYALTVGLTGPGSNDLFASGTTTDTTATVPSLRATCATVYVRLYSKVGAATESTNYTYKEQ